MDHSKPEDDSQLKTLLHERGKFYITAYRAAMWIEEQVRELGRPMSDDHFRTCCHTMFLDARDMGGGTMIPRKLDLKPKDIKIEEVGGYDFEGGISELREMGQ